MTDQKAEKSASVCVFLTNFCSIALAFSASSVVDQGSRPNVKLASAITMSALLAAFSIGRWSICDEITDIAKFDLIRQYLSVFFFSTTRSTR